MEGISFISLYSLYLSMHIDDSGNHFRVVILAEYFVEIPRTAKIREKLDDIVEVQNHVAEQVDGILSVERVDDLLVMLRVPGERADERDDWLYLRELRDEIQSEVNDLGYVIMDIGASDMFYDEADDQLYLVDFSQVKRYEGVYG